MGRVDSPAAIAHFTSTQVIFSNSTWSVVGHGLTCADSAACADPGVSTREAAPQATDISKNCNTEPTRMSFSSCPVFDLCSHLNSYLKQKITQIHYRHDYNSADA